MTEAADRRARLRRFSALHDRCDEWGWRVLATTADFSLHYPVPDLLGSSSARGELAIGGEWCGWPAQVTLVAARPAAPGTRWVRGARRETFLLSTVDSGPVRSQFVVQAGRGGVEVAMLSRGSLPARARRRLDGAFLSGTLLRGDQVAVGEVQVLAARRFRRAASTLDPAPHLTLLTDLLGDLGAG